MNSFARDLLSVCELCQRRRGDAGPTIGLSEALA